MKLRLLSILLTTLVLTACFPVHYLMRPGISGSVVDDSTSAPVADATVILSRLGQTDRPLIATVTDINGRFVLSARSAWGIYIVPEDVFDFLGTVDIYASGYVKASRQIRSKVIGNSAPIVLGEIHVNRPPFFP